MSEFAQLSTLLPQSAKYLQTTPDLHVHRHNLTHTHILTTVCVYNNHTLALTSSHIVYTRV